jgi:hypothetical protein
MVRRRNQTNRKHESEIGRNTRSRKWKRKRKMFWKSKDEISKDDNSRVTLFNIFPRFRSAIFRRISPNNQEFGIF